MEYNIVVNNNQNGIVEERKFDSTSWIRFIKYLDASPKTRETYEKAIRQFIQFLSFYDISQPTRETIIRYKEYMSTERGFKATTIQAYMTAVRLFFSWLEQEGLYPNIASHVKGGKIRKEYRKDYLTKTQVNEVLQGIDTSTAQGLRDYAIIALMITGGLRDIEVARANIEDIRNVGELTVLYIQGKGRVEKDDYTELDPKVEQAIRSYLKTRTGESETAPLFTSLDHKNIGNRLTTRSISRIVKTRLQQAGFDSSRLTAHSLRHTAITIAYLGGMPITEVQQFARHSNIATTMVYAHMLDKSKNRCCKVISNAIFN